MYCGTIVTEEGKEKKVNIDFEPFKPINTSLYLCDNKVRKYYTYYYMRESIGVLGFNDKLCYSFIQKH